MQIHGLLFLGLGVVALVAGCKSQRACSSGGGGGPGFLACKGETYDVNGNPADGCEVHDTPADNHTQDHAFRAGGASACDNGGTVGFNVSGVLPSDRRCHDPAIDGFDAKSGSAPDWISIQGLGHVFCENDLVATLEISGSTNPTCYHLAINTGKFMYQCDTDASGQCGVNMNSGQQWEDSANILFTVSKTCSSAELVEAPTYRIFGHL